MKAIAIFLSLLSVTQIFAGDFTGFYRSQLITLDVRQDRMGINAGELKYGESRFPILSVESEGSLVGIFKDGDNQFSFSLTKTLQGYIFATGETAKILEKIPAPDFSQFAGKTFKSQSPGTNLQFTEANGRTIIGNVLLQEKTFPFQATAHEHLIEGIVTGESGKPSTFIASFNGEQFQFQNEDPEFDRHKLVVPPEIANGTAFFKLDELFDGTHYGDYNSYSQKQILKQAQTKFKAQSLYTSKVDGIPGKGTQGAIFSYQHNQGIPESGRLDAATLNSLQLTGIAEVPFTLEGAWVLDYKMTYLNRTNGFTSNTKSHEKFRLDLGAKKRVISYQKWSILGTDNGGEDDGSTYQVKVHSDSHVTEWHDGEYQWTNTFKLDPDNPDRLIFSVYGQATGYRLTGSGSGYRSR